MFFLLKPMEILLFYQNKKYKHSSFFICTFFLNQQRNYETYIFFFFLLFLLLKSKNRFVQLELVQCGRGYACYRDSALSPLLILFRFEIFGTVSFPFPRTLIESNFETKLDNSGLWSYEVRHPQFIHSYILTSTQLFIILLLEQFKRIGRRQLLQKSSEQENRDLTSMPKSAK